MGGCQKGWRWGGSFFNLLQKEGLPRKERGKGGKGGEGERGGGGVPAMEETKSLQCAYFVNDGLQSASMN